MKRVILAVVVLSALSGVQQVCANQAAPIPEQTGEKRQSAAARLSKAADEAIAKQLDTVVSHQISALKSASGGPALLTEITNATMTLTTINDETKKLLAAAEKAKGSSFENRFYVVQGVEYSTSQSKDDSENLFEDENYYLQLFYDWKTPWCTNLSVGFSIDFRQAYAETTNTVTTADHIRKADQLGMSISPKLSFPTLPGVFVRGDIRGIMVQSKEPDVDEEMKWEPGLMLGIEKMKDNHFFRGEFGGVYYERLPDNELRTMARMSYGYQLANYAVLTSLEFNGLEHKGEQEARAQLGLQLSPDKFFKPIGKFLEGVFKLNDDDA